MHIHTSNIDMYMHILCHICTSFLNDCLKKSYLTYTYIYQYMATADYYDEFKPVRKSILLTSTLNTVVNVHYIQINKLYMGHAGGWMKLGRGHI